VSFFISMGILFYAYARANLRLIYFFLMGLALGAAFMTKTSGMFLVLWGGAVVITDFLFGKGKLVWRDLFMRVLMYSCGVFLVIGILFALIAIKGSFNEMIFWAYEIPKKYVSKIPWSEGKKLLDYMFTSITAEYKFFWVHAFAGLAVVVIKGISWRKKAMGLLLIFFSCMTIVPGFYFYGHYWIQIIPGLSILAGLTFYGFNYLLTEKFNVRSQRTPYIYVAVFLVFALMHLNRNKSYYFHPNYDRILRTVYGNNPFPESMAIANYINSISKPEDGIVVMGSEPQIYFYTKKHCPSRHAYFAALVDDTPQHKEWQREFVRDVEKAKPRFFVFFNHQISLFVQPGTDRYIFDWYNKYVTDNYHIIGVVDMIDGYTSNYVWKEQLSTYKMQSQTAIYVYERNEGK